MFETIDPRSPTPIWDQIAARIRVAVAAGELRAGEGLPSVRELARRLRINPATVAQAYKELAKEGFVEARHGAGTFVLDVSQVTRSEERKRQAAELVGRMLEEAARFGINGSDLAEAFYDQVGRSTHE